MPREFSIPIGRPRTPSRLRRFFAVCRMAWNCWRSNRSSSSVVSPLKALPYPRLPRHLLVLMETAPEHRYIAIVPNGGEGGDAKQITFHQLNGVGRLSGVQPGSSHRGLWEDLDASLAASLKLWSPTQSPNLTPADLGVSHLVVVENGKPRVLLRGTDAISNCL